MIDRQTYLRLQDVIRREGRSFLQYAGESFPWSTSADHDTVAQIKTLIKEEAGGSAALSKFLTKNRLTPPYLGAYPSYFTSYNYMALDKLLSRLVQHQNSDIEEIDKDLAAIEDGETRKQIQQVLEMKRRHLQTLEKLAAPPTAIA